jgi:hypothetical protein
VAYLKRAEDIPLFARYMSQYNLSGFPVVLLQNDVCWDELLFEIEVDAVDTGS